MTKDPPPPTKGSNLNESASKRKRRKKRKAQKKKKNQTGVGGSSKSSKTQKQPQPIQTVHLPHAKCTLRNIQNSQKYGNVEDVIGLLRDLIRERNNAKGDATSEEAAMIAKVVNPVDIVLDETSIARILDRDRIQKEYLKEKLNENENEAGEEKEDVGKAETENQTEVEVEAQDGNKENTSDDQCPIGDRPVEDGSDDTKDSALVDTSMNVDIDSEEKAEDPSSKQEQTAKSEAPKNAITAKILVSGLDWIGLN